MESQHWFVYFVRCSDGSLYAGISTDVEQTMKTTNNGVGSVYTRSRLPVFLAHSEEYMNEIDAQNRLTSVQRMSRAKKEYILVAAQL